MSARFLAFLRTLVAIWCLIELDPAWAGNCLLTLCGGTGFPGATVYLNFAAGQYKGLSLGQMTFTRASPWWTVCNGTLSTFANNTAPITPCGYDGGWETRTGLGVNNLMQGAVAGTPGALPTNWTITTAGLTQQVVATGTLTNGMPYIDIKLSGTTSSRYIDIGYNGNGFYSLNYGNTYSTYIYSAFVDKTDISNLSSCAIKSYDGVQAPFSTAFSTSASLAQYTSSFTLKGSFIQNWVECTMTGASGQTANFTLRLVLPQLELNPNLPASVASATVAGGGAAYVGASGTMTYSGVGCTTNPVLNVTTSAGAINAVTSVATAGVCPAANGLPVAGATTWTPGGGLSVGTGASFSLVPVDNSAQAFATPPILTTSGAVTRAATNATGPLPSCSNPSVYVAGTPAAPTTYPVTQFAALVDDGGTTNLVKMIRAASTGQPVVGTKTQTVTVSGGPWAQSTAAKLTESIGGGSVNGRFNGGTVSTAAATSPPALNRLQIGSQGGINNFNGVIPTLAIACNGQSLLNN